MAKKQRKQQKDTEKTGYIDAQQAAPKSGNSLKDMLGAEALAKLKLVEKEMKEEQDRAVQEAAERRRREQEEKEKNKSFADLLADYDRKGGGKYS